MVWDIKNTNYFFFQPTHHIIEWQKRGAVLVLKISLDAIYFVFENMDKHPFLIGLYVQFHLHMKMAVHNQLKFSLIKFKRSSDMFF
jgi:hypothetical protein